MTSGHGSSTQLCTPPPPLRCQYHYPPTRLSNSQTDVLKGKRYKEGLLLGSHTAFLEGSQNDVTRRSHLEAQTSKTLSSLYQSAKQFLVNDQGLNSLRQGGHHVPPLLVPHTAMSPLSHHRFGMGCHPCELWVGEAEQTRPIDHTALLVRGGLIYLKKKYVSSVFTPSTFQQAVTQSEESVTREALLLAPIQLESRMQFCF